DDKTNETTTEDQTDSISHKTDRNGLSVVTGEYIFTDDAAVIKGRSFIYGVVLDSMAKSHGEKIKPLKRDQYDMVPVTVKGKIEPNPMKDGWDEVVKITKILKISKPDSDPAIEISSGKK